MRSTNAAYGRVAQLFHWAGTLVIVLLIPLGMVMVRLGAGDTKTMLYGVHIALGLLIAVLTVARLIWRFTDPTPATPPGMSKGRRLAFHGVHILLYVLLFPLIASGIGMLLTSGLSLWPGAVDPAAISRDLAPRVGHDIGSKVYLVLVVAHIGGVALYQRLKGDVLSRMGVRIGSQ